MTPTLNPNANTNGSPRKNLASQLDRLDGIVDGLAEGLKDAVASAVTVAVQEAVRALLAEVLTHPDVLANLRGLVSQTTATTSTAATQVVSPATKSWRGNVAATVSAWCGRGGRALRHVGASLVGRVRNVRSSWRRRWQRVRQFRVPLLTAVVMGAVAGLGAYGGGPYVAALAGWLAGFTTTLTVQAGRWLRPWLEGSPRAAR